MDRFAGRVVLVTGASSGIGAAVAREFARRGADLVPAARRLPQLLDLAAELRATGRRALAVSPSRATWLSLWSVGHLAEPAAGAAP